MTDHIVDATKMVPPADLVELVTEVMLSTFRTKEPDHPISVFPVSYIATFQDMARAVIALFAEREKAAAGPLEALEEIANPLTAMKRRAEAQGHRLSGMAYSIANSADHLQGIARNAIAAAGAAGIRGREPEPN